MNLNACGNVPLRNRTKACNSGVARDGMVTWWCHTRTCVVTPMIVILAINAIAILDDCPRDKGTEYYGYICVLITIILAWHCETTLPFTQPPSPQASSQQSYHAGVCIPYGFDVKEHRRSSMAPSIPDFALLDWWVSPPWLHKWMHYLRVFLSTRM